MKKKVILATIMFLMAVISSYACAVILPYEGTLTITKETKQKVNINDLLENETSKERVMLLEDSYESFIHRMRIINGATKEIYFSSYATNEGTSTDILIGGLLKKASEGVKVSIILDAKFAGLSKENERILAADNNIALYYFNETSLLKPQMLNVAMHDKMLVIDNHYMIVGSRNVGDKYYNTKSFTNELSLDREVLVYNPTDTITKSISEGKEYLKSLINSQLAKEIINKKKDIKHQEQLIEKYDMMINHIMEIDYYQSTYETNKVTLITNPIEGTKKEPIIAYYLYLLAKSSNEVFIQTPYTILSKENQVYLKEVSDNANVTLLTNSIASTPNIPAYSNYHVNRDKYLSLGINIYEYQGIKTKKKLGKEASIHAKTYIFDDRISIIGSFNLDERSIRIDTESMLVIDSASFVAHVKEVLKEYLDDSLMVNNDGTYQSKDDLSPKPVSSFKSFIYDVVGVIFKPFDYLL